MIRFGNIHDKSCTKCNSRDFERVRKSVLVRLVSFGTNSLKKYQCAKCWRTFYIVTKKTSRGQEYQYQ
jgi:DNA-directed RNA polymerase subunit RPC12/RpoP